MIKNIDDMYYERFTRPVIRIGRISMFIAVFACFVPSIYLVLRYGALPPLSAILSGWAMTAAVYVPFYFIEPVSYFPVLGIAGTYMSFLAGEIGNMRLPCAAIAQSVLKVEEGTKKAELVSTLAIAGSVVTSVVAGILSVFLGSIILNILPAGVLRAFDFVLPAVFGSMFAMFALKAPKLGAYALALVLILKIFTPLPVAAVLPITIFSTIAIGAFEHKRKSAKEAKN